MIVLLIEGTLKQKYFTKVFHKLEFSILSKSKIFGLLFLIKINKNLEILQIGTPRFTALMGSGIAPHY